MYSSSKPPTRSWALLLSLASAAGSEGAADGWRFRTAGALGEFVLAAGGAAGAGGGPGGRWLSAACTLFARASRV